MKKKRFHYYEDEDIVNHLHKNNIIISKWVREATRKKYQKETK